MHDFQTLMHKVRLLERSHKQQLGSEKNRQSDLQKRLNQAEREITTLRRDIKVKTSLVSGLGKILLDVSSVRHFSTFST